MSKSLVRIALGGFGLALAFFVLAYVFSGNSFRFLSQMTGEKPAGIGPGVREWAWTGGDRLDIDMPATVTLVPGSPRVVVHGDNGALNSVLFDDKRLALSDAYQSGLGEDDNLKVTLQGITLRHIVLGGAGKVALGHVDQDRLSIHISGAGSVSGEGHVGDLEIDVSGAGSAKLGKLAADRAEIRISGAGNATIAPRDRARVDISGVGHVRLTTRPKALDTHISGFGNVTGPDGQRVTGGE